MMVWRIQHDCDGFHGPHCTTGCTRYEDLWDNERPNFGAAGEPPSNIKNNERCGVTTEQFPYWWAPKYIFSNVSTTKVASEVPDRLPQNWFAILFDVKDHAARIDNNQVVFDPNHATEVFRTQTDFPR